MLKLLSAVLSLLFVFSASPVFAQTLSFPSNITAERVPGQILVKFRQTVPENTVELKVDGYSAKIRSRLERLNTLVLNVPQAQQDAIIAAFSRLPNVQFAEPD